jgi:hypothetical protein
VTEAVFFLGVFVFGGLVLLKAFNPAMYTNITSAGVSVVNDFISWLAQSILRFLGSLFRF